MVEQSGLVGLWHYGKSRLVKILLHGNSVHVFLDASIANVQGVFELVDRVVYSVLGSRYLLTEVHARRLILVFGSVFRENIRAELRVESLVTRLTYEVSLEVSTKLIVKGEL